MVFPVSTDVAKQFETYLGITITVLATNKEALQ